MGNVNFNNNNNTSTGGGIGFFGLLAIVFITLKLIGEISWSWLWVLAPIWMPLLIGGIILMIVILVALIWS